MKIRIKKLHPDAILPNYAHGAAEDAGQDLRALERIVLRPGTAEAVPTGIAIELPPGYEAQVRPRSGLGLKHSITVNFGTIDPGYRGEIRVIMFNLGLAEYAIEKGDRIAQLIVSRYEAVEWDESELGDSVRGADGFGSSGR
ncbi:MAG: dUTP diphosphatase [Bryobacteraceae bacterium]|jgi:dUTP pyrophosphatase